MMATPRTRTCSHEKNTDYVTRKSKRICIPIDPETYQQVLADKAAFKAYLDQQIAAFPELFPATIAQGYTLQGFVPPSAKMPEVRMRRIAIPTSNGGPAVRFTVAPSFVLPYMTGYTYDVEAGLFLCKFDVPPWALARVFGRDAMYWERLALHFGYNSVVGTTVKDPEALPAHLLADEKHTWVNGEKAYVATTVGAECVLGASVTLSADTPGLQEGYSHFKVEAQDLQPDYTPATVNIDGWDATQAAWLNLFALVTIIRCFLHAFLKIRDCGKRLKAQFTEVCTRVWECYRAPDQDTFLARVQTLQTWATEHLPPGAAVEAVLKLCAKAPLLAQAYDHPGAYRTSNMLDRHMNPMDRSFDRTQYCHGHLMTAEYRVRAWALLHNFLPYGPRTGNTNPYQSPAHQLNGRVYHEDWLQNLLISASMGGWRQ